MLTIGEPPLRCSLLGSRCTTRAPGTVPPLLRNSPRSCVRDSVTVAMARMLLTRRTCNSGLGGWRRRRGWLLLLHALAIERHEIHRIDHQRRKAAIAHRIRDDRARQREQQA